MKDPSTLAILLMQIAVVVALSRLMGMLVAKFRQPQVIGEITAGLMLGPSLLGWVAPSVHLWLFSNADARQMLGMFSQVGVILFLFTVGLHFDPQTIRQHGKSAIAISLTGVAVPFALGFMITYPLIGLFDSAQRAHPFASALFMGAAMSVTAFPVLARIVTECNLQRTQEGSLALTASAVGDVLAWVMLAVVVAFAPAGGSTATPLTRLGFAAVYGLVMLCVIKPTLRGLGAVFNRKNELTSGILAFVLVTLLLSCFATEIIGVHALFGAFVAGLMMPREGRFADEVNTRIQLLTIALFLPTFFAYTGLVADLRNLFDRGTFTATLLIIAIAVGGKFGGTFVAALSTGVSRHKSLMVGILMNTRGLMELIILTAGLQAGVINQKVYGMMVVMALVTTGMAVPLIHWLGAESRSASPSK